MKNRSTKILSLVLALIMVFSLVPVSAYAAPSTRSETGVVAQTDGPNSFFGDLGRLIKSWGKILSPKPFMPAITLVSDEFDGVTVTVKAPTGALPEGTTMEVKPVSNMDAVQAAVDETPDVSGTALIAADITFFDADGNEIQPAKAITVAFSSDELAGREDLTVVHLDLGADELGENEVPAEPVESTVNANVVSFEADHFSVYALIGDPDDPDQPYRATYEFYNSDGTPYEFTNAAGDPQTSQILKNGEILEDVGIPTVGASANAKFVGWYVLDANGNMTTEKCNVDEAKTVTANVTIKLKAKMQGIVNVMFVSAVMLNDQGQPMNRTIVTVKQVPYEVGQTTPITVVTSDVTTDAPTSDQAVVGWNRNETAANAGTAEGSPITLYANGNAADIGDVTLFPAIKNTYWLYFKENGDGASYTPPQYVQIGSNPTKPTDPHRTGYDFGGWYKDEACSNGQEFNFNEPLPGTTTVYAKWVGSATTYTIIVWEQRTADSSRITSSSNLSNDQKTYDFYTSYTINSSTGAQATATSTSMGLGTTLDADGHIKYNRNDGPKEVAGNGSTVINVYYDRDVMTIHFKQNQNSSSDLYTWYGLYDATFTESGKTWPTLTNQRWTSADYTYTFMDAFVDFDTRAATVLTLWQQNSGSSYYDYIFQKETLTSGTYTTANSSARTGNLKLSEKYKGFTLYRYRNGQNGNWTYTNGSYPSVSNANSDLYIQYQRNTYTLTFQNSTRGTPKNVIRTDNVKYEAPLNGYSTPAAPTYPVAADADHYNFIGWFADSNWTTLVSFTPMTEAQMNEYREYYGVSTFIFYTSQTDTMPAHNMVLYAGYALKGWDIMLNPNGGTLTNPNQAGVFWLYYGDKISSDIKVNIHREGYTFQGWMVANVPLDSDGNLVQNNVYREGPNNLRYEHDFSNWTITDTPWEFDTGITGPTALMAKWFYLETMHVVYDDGEGDNAPEDEGAYSDHATTVAFHAPNPPAGKFFLGWDIQGTDADERLHPGDTFEVSSDYATNGVVTLVAVYGSSMNEDDPVPVTHIDWYANNKTTGSYPQLDPITLQPVLDEDDNQIMVTQLTHVSDTGIQLNEGVNIRPYNQFTNYGYTFLGWAKLHDDNGTLKDHKGNTVAAATGEQMDYALTAANLYLKYENGKFYVQSDGQWKETSQVAADENKPYDDLYAVWDQSYFFVYHSSTGNLEAVAMSECNEDGEFDLTSKLAENTLYGGYYSACGAVTEANVNTAKPNALAADSHQAAVIGAVIYDGTALKNGTVRFWTKGNAYTDVKGTEMSPVVDTVYYLKEVPNVYLGTHARWVYKWTNNEVIQMYFLTVVDDTYYKNIGFKIISTDKTASLVTSFSYQVNGSSNIKVIKPNDLIGRRGYIGVVDGTDFITDIANSTESSPVQVLPFWTTLDGVRISTAGYSFYGDGSGTLTIGNLNYKANP